MRPLPRREGVRQGERHEGGCPPGEATSTALHPAASAAGRAGSASVTDRSITVAVMDGLRPGVMGKAAARLCVVRQDDDLGGEAPSGSDGCRGNVVGYRGAWTDCIVGNDLQVVEHSAG